MASDKKADNEREPFHWQTSIAYKVRDRIVVRGYDVNELAGTGTITPPPQTLRYAQGDIS